MLGNFQVEVFTSDYEFRAYTLAKAQKHEYDYMSIGNDDLTLSGYVEIYKRDYIQIRSDDRVIQGVISAVDHVDLETKIKYKCLLSILNVEVYQDRNLLRSITAEEFLGKMIRDNFILNEDALQNIRGLEVVCESETADAALNLKDNMHNIYELALKAFRKYGIVIEMSLDIMGQKLLCRIGKPQYKIKTIEADLKNVLGATVVIKEDDESVNKVIVIGEYDEEDSNYGQTVRRTYYLDKQSGETTMTPAVRAEPVVFRYKELSYNEESFEEDAFEAAYDLIYKEEYDNSIKIQLAKDDPLHKLQDFEIGMPCTIIQNGKKYRTIFTGYSLDKIVTLFFGMVRTEYTKKIRRY